MILQCPQYMTPTPPPHPIAHPSLHFCTPCPQHPQYMPLTPPPHVCFHPGEILSAPYHTYTPAAPSRYDSDPTTPSLRLN
ncbi:hypothetical protein O181_017297 [Austropuccinia psidii MF-1]|uniref:Uncharacterized protein n=1 Tax=Austropuccinia psidii MF-1 TaxID=1389203 RepID=A0A9Q3GSG1_9BASI|nr:hypothetical protein [Austropuccinia psidii MF-1]